MLRLCCELLQIVLKILYTKIENQKEILHLTCHIIKEKKIQINKHVNKVYDSAIEDYEALADIQNTIKHVLYA